MLATAIVDSTLPQNWTRAGLFGSGSGRDFQIIPGFFRVDIQHVNTKYFLSFFKYFCCIFNLNLHSVASTRLDYIFFYFAIMACSSDVTKEQCVLVTLFRAEIKLLVLSSGSDSGSRVRAEKTRPRLTLLSFQRWASTGEALYSNFESLV